MERLVARGGDLPDLSPLVPGFERRRHRRPPGHHRAAALCRRPRRRRGLAVADLHLADARHGLRCLATTPTSTRSSARSPTSTPWSTRAHALGLKVIIDQVLVAFVRPSIPSSARAGTSRDNPKADWYVWADPKHDGSPPNNWLSVFGGGAWAWDPRRRQYYLHNFLAEQPDFNFHNPEVQDWLLGTMRFWLERGVDGFRLDTVNFYFHDKLLRDDPAGLPPQGRRRRGIPTTCSTTSSRRTSRRTSRSSSGCASCSTSTRRAPWSARWARATTRSG